MPRENFTSAHFRELSVVPTATVTGKRNDIGMVNLDGIGQGNSNECRKRDQWHAGRTSKKP
jgi:hypothetical protein